MQQHLLVWSIIVAWWLLSGCKTWSSSLQDLGWVIEGSSRPLGQAAVKSVGTSTGLDRDFFENTKKTRYTGIIFSLSMAVCVVFWVLLLKIKLLWTFWICVLVHTGNFLKEIYPEVEGWSHRGCASSVY